MCKKDILFLVGVFVLCTGCATIPIVQPTLEEYEAIKKTRQNVAVVKISDAGSSITGIDQVVTNKLEGLFLTRFNVIERQQIEEVLKEKDFQQTEDVEAVIEIGKILGVDYIIMGSVVGTVSGPSHHSRDYVKEGKFYGSIWEEIKSDAQIDIKIIDVVNGALFKTLSSKGSNSKKQNQMSFGTSDAYKSALKIHAIKTVLSVVGYLKDLEQDKESLVIKAIDKAIGNLSNSLAAVFVVEGEVMSIVSAKEVMINMGSVHNIAPGDYITVWEQQEEVIDPRTGLSVSPRTKKGRLKIMRVTSGLTAIAKGSSKIVSTIRPGDIISLQR